MYVRYLLLFLISFQPLYSAHLSDEDVKKRWAFTLGEINAISKQAAMPYLGAGAVTHTESSLAKPVLRRSNATAGAMAGANSEFVFTLKRSHSHSAALAKTAATCAQSASAAATGAQAAPTSPRSPLTPLLSYSPTTSAATPASPPPAAPQIKEDTQSFTQEAIRNNIANAGLCYWILNPDSSDKTIPDLEAVVARDTATFNKMRKVDLGAAFASLNTAEKEAWLKLTAHRRYTFWTYNNGLKNPNQHTVFPIAQFTPSTVATLSLMRWQQSTIF
jgi:hypothetical protein